MPTSIWKYDLTPEAVQYIDMPDGAQVLCLHMQYDTPRIWVLAESDLPKTRRTFRVFGTGNPIEDDLSTLKYVGTFQIYGGTLVFHVFEEQ